ncbi:Eco57I restriction-modification methylase domain-containing protein [Bradyrhizobium sp. USDA 4449]
MDLSPLKGTYDHFANVQRSVDFLRWSRATDQRFDKIIANPPYVAIERLQPAERTAACSVAPFDGVGVKAAGNLWLAFLVASIGLLRPSGGLCFLLPAAWDFANYSEDLRSKIGNWFDRVDVHRSQEPLFRASGIQDGSVVVVATHLRDSPSDLKQPTRFEYQDASQLVKGLASVSSSARRIRPPVSAPAVLSSVDTARLDSAASITIGGVTGDSSYFVLNESQRIAHGLPTSAMRPVLSRARHLVSSSIDRDIWDKLKSAGERIWLFDPPPSIVPHKAVQKYIRWGRNGGCRTTNHKIAGRTPWYRTKIPSAPDGFLSGMTSVGPVICLRGMDRLTATNTLYVITFDRGLTTADRAAVSLALLKSSVGDQLRRIGRTYADGLIKFEPGDLRQVRIPRVAHTAGAEKTYRRALNELLAGHETAARKLADEWFSSRV